MFLWVRLSEWISFKWELKEMKFKTLVGEGIDKTEAQVLTLISSFFN